jgi:hypothetical protein
MLLVYRYRVKSLTGLLNSQSRACNFVWNFCNETQQQALKWNKRWPTGFDLNRLTAGSSKELALHAGTINAVWRPLGGGGEDVKVRAFCVVVRSSLLVLMITAIGSNADCASLVESMSAHCRALPEFPTCLGMKLGVLLIGNGLHHCVNGVLDPCKIIAAILVKGGGL